MVNFVCQTLLPLVGLRICLTWFLFVEPNLDAVDLVYIRSSDYVCESR